MRTLLLLAALLSLAHGLAAQAPGSIDGLYRAGGGETLVLFPAPGQSVLRAMIALDSGEVRVLFPEGEEEPANAFTYGPAIAVREPVRGRVEVVRANDGTAEALVQRAADADSRRYERVEVRQEPVHFANGDVRLAGTLLVPPGRGPFPAVVMLHGSEPEPREGNLGVALVLVSEGIAALVFDKRGVGASSPVDWRAALADYAGDAQAGFAAVAEVAHVDSTRIGYWGHSQGAWVAALAASRTPGAAFVVLECGGAVDPVETTLWGARRWMEARTRLGPQGIEDCLAYRRQKFDVVAGRLSAEAFATSTDAVRDQPWFAAVTDRLPDGPFWEANVDYDPRPALEGLNHCPVLALYAEHDDLTPTAASIAAAEAAFERARHPRATVLRIDGANHGFFETLTGRRMDDELPTLQRFAPDYAPLLVEWLHEVLDR